MKQILVIEDNREVNENLCEILELAGYHVFSATDGKKGIEITNNELPDLILCDVMMPHLDGYGVLKILSQNENTAHIPLIFLTAKSEMKDLRKGMNLGAADYILKPFDDVDLLQSIAIRLSQKKTNKATSKFGNQGTIGLNIDRKILALRNDWIDKYEKRVYPNKTDIYLNGNLSRFVYFITKGIVRIHKSNDIGKRITLDLAGANTLIGEQAIIQNESYNHDASALTDCEIILIPQQEFLELLENESLFSLYCYQNAIGSLEQMRDAYLEMAYGSVRRKVAISLIKYANTFYDNSLKNGMSIYLPREELAELVGAAKETIIRTLSDFKAEGLIDIMDNKTILADIDGLVNMPN